MNPKRKAGFGVFSRKPGGVSGIPAAQYKTAPNKVSLRRISGMNTKKNAHGKETCSNAK